MQEDKRAKQLARLEQARLRTHERMTAQQRRVEARFDRIRARIMSDESRPSVDQQRIIAAALELLDEGGLNDLSLRKLAAKLGLQAPALYWHFKNKEELIDYMAEHILAKEFADIPPRKDGESWQEWLIVLCKRLRKAMLTHRDGARIVAGAHLYPAVTLIRLMEAGSEALVSSGVDEARAELIISTAAHFTFGRVIEEQSAPSAEQMAALDFAGLAQHFPYLARSITRIQAAGNLVELSDRDFDESLRLIIHE